MAQPRYTYRRSFFSGYFPTGVKWLLIFNTAVFILTGLLSPQFTSDIMLLALAPVAVVKHFAIWQLATYLFLHGGVWHLVLNRKSTRLNSSHLGISYAVFCLKKRK